MQKHTCIYLIYPIHLSIHLCLLQPSHLYLQNIHISNIYQAYIHPIHPIHLSITGYFNRYKTVTSLPISRSSPWHPALPLRCLGPDVFQRRDDFVLRLRGHHDGIQLALRLRGTGGGWPLDPPRHGETVVGINCQ